MLRGEHDILARAGFALGRLSEAVKRSPLARLWVHHEAALVVSRLFSRGAQPIGPEELLALVANLPGTMPTMEEAAARRFWSDALGLWSLPSGTEAPSAGLAEAITAVEEQWRAGMPTGELALDAPMRFASVTSRAIPSISLALPASEADFKAQFPSLLAEACTEGLERLEALERDFARWQSLLPQARSDSRLDDALVLLGTVHALTPRYVGDSLGLTRQGAARLLRRLAELGIIRKATNRQRWLIYLAENAAPAGLVPETTRTETPRTVDTARVDAVLEEAYAALDRAAKRDDA